MPPKSPDNSSTNASASDQKLAQGEDTGEQRPVQEPQGTVLGIGSSKQVEGELPLVRMIGKKGESKKVDLWNSVVVGIKANYFEQIIQMSAKFIEYDMTEYIRSIEYQGFDRIFYINHALTLMSVSIFCRFAILGALRGSNFDKIIDNCEKMPDDMISAFKTCNFIKTPKKRTGISILRNTASIPHWCVFWMMKAGVVKKINGSKCPSELQFPGAASLPMSREVRLQHLDFCQQFSSILPGGKFNLNIYLVAYNNSIPIQDIPVEVLTLLGVGSNSDNYLLKEQELEQYTKAIVRTTG